MQGRSWMAALTLTTIAALALGYSARAGEKQASYKVRLSLHIAGLGQQGCDVEIKPAHGGCKFRPIKKHVTYQGSDDILIDDVQTNSADKECAFAITVSEPGHPIRTVRKGLHLRTSEPAGVSRLECFISSPSKVASTKDESSKRR